MAKIGGNTTGSTPKINHCARASPVRGPGGVYFGTPEGGCRTGPYGRGAAWGGTGATFYDCFGLFEHISTDFVFFRFCIPPYPTPKLFKNFDEKFTKISKNLEKIAKILKIFPIVLCDPWKSKQNRKISNRSKCVQTTQNNHISAYK